MSGAFAQFLYQANAPIIMTARIPKVVARRRGHFGLDALRSSREIMSSLAKRLRLVQQHFFSVQWKPPSRPVS